MVFYNCNQDIGGWNTSNDNKFNQDIMARGILQNVPVMNYI